MVNNLKKVLLVFGTRPEAIKMAPLVHAMERESEHFKPIVCVTAQHRGMLDQVLKVFDIQPDLDLNLMQPGQDLFDVTASVLLHMRDVLCTHRPDVLLVHGDTTTTVAAAMAGFYLGIPVGHVEAGLRTRDIRSPFPEEFNRQVASKVTRWHFAPTPLSRENLIAEGVTEAHITVTGNTVIDSLRWVLARIDSMPWRREAIVSMFRALLPFDLLHERFVLITGHRRENFGDGFEQIFNALKELSARYQKIQFVYPVHLNPNVREPAHAILGGIDNVHLIQPLDYEPFIYLLSHCYIVLTDSGGIQEEAPSLGKPVLVMREATERPEALQAGTVRLVGCRRDSIVANLSELLDDKSIYRAMATAHNPYGDGHACERILSVLRMI